LLSQIVVVSLALTLVTACSSAGKKDCKLLLEAKEVFKTDYSDLTLEAQAMQTARYAIGFKNVELYILQLNSIQFLLQEPKLQEYTNDYLKDIESYPREKKPIKTSYFVNAVDIYCNSL